LVTKLAYQQFPVFYEMSTPVAIFNMTTIQRYRYNYVIQVAQLSQRDRAAGWVSFGQTWKTGTWRQYLADIVGLSSTTVTWLATKAIEFCEKRKIRAITPFKVIQGHQGRTGRYQSKARMRLSIRD